MGNKIKNKKILIILIAFIIIFTVATIISKNISSDEENLNNIIESSEEVVKNAQLDNPPEESKPGGNYSGTILLENRSELINSITDEEIKSNVILIANTLPTQNLDYINIVIEDAEEDILEEYFEVNKETIFTLWGISEFEDFKSFYQEIKDLKHISIVNIDIDSFNIENNVATYSINIKDTDVSLKFKSIVNDSYVSFFYLGGE